MAGLVHFYYEIQKICGEANTVLPDLITGFTERYYNKLKEY